MSGSGLLSPRREIGFRSATDRAVARAIAAEREAVGEHIRAKIAAAQRHLGDDAGHLVRCLDELACDFEGGLHVREVGQ